MRSESCWILPIFLLVCMSTGCHRSERLLDRIEPPAKVINESIHRSDSGGAFSSKEKEALTLKNQIPISKEVLKTWVPESVASFKRTQLISGHRDDSGIVSVLAEYQHREMKAIGVKVEILDGAGENGFILIQAAMNRLKLDLEEDKGGLATRIYSRKGIRVRESENKESRFAEIEFVDQNRYLFQIKGFGLSVSQLWEFSSLASFNQP